VLLGYDYLSQGIYAQGAFPKIIGGVVGVTVGNAPCKIGDRTTTIGDRTDATSAMWQSPSWMILKAGVVGLPLSA